MLDYFDYGEYVSIYLEDGPVMVFNHEDRYALVMDLISKDSWQELRAVLNPNKIFENDPSLCIHHNVVLYKGEELPSSLANFIVKNKKNGEDISSVLKFWTSLKFNEKFTSSSIVRSRVYKVLDKGFSFCADKFFYEEDQSVLVDGFYNIKKLNQIYYDKVIELRELSKLLEWSFGFYSKKLEKIVKPLLFDSSNIKVGILNFGLLFKDLLDPNSLYSLIEKNIIDLNVLAQRDPEIFVVGNELMKKISENKSGYSAKKLLNMFEREFVIENFNNCLYLYREYKEQFNVVGDFSNFSQLSEYLQKESVKLGNANFLLEQERHHESLQFLKLDINEDFKIEIAKEFYQVVKWGQIMGNCIGGKRYSKSAKEGKIILLAIYKRGNLLYNLEISSGGSVKQFERKRKTRVNPEEKKMVLSHLRKYKVVV